MSKKKPARIQLAEIRKHSGYVACASVSNRTGGIPKNLLPKSEEDPINVDLCIKHSFAGDKRKFLEWAQYYLEYGMGIAG